MAYVDGFVIPIKKKDLAAYRRISKAAGRIWKEYGALDYVETAGDDLAPKGQFRKMTKVSADETVVFSWIVYRSKAHRNAVNKKVMKDPRLEAMMQGRDMPFDVKRMAYGGFRVIVQQ
jgi:uncharacterized protein YbaA (DUF1428 family)